MSYQPHYSDPAPWELACDDCGRRICKCRRCRHCAVLLVAEHEYNERECNDCAAIEHDKEAA